MVIPNQRTKAPSRKDSTNSHEVWRIFIPAPSIMARARMMMMLDRILIS